MSKEVEAKFRLKIKPDFLRDGKEISQTYLDFQNNDLVKEKIKETFGEVDLGTINESRVRVKGTVENLKYFLTLKGDGTLERDEHEEEIEKDLFNELLAEGTLGQISKIRYEIALKDGLTAEIDEYREKLEGLIVAEVEFDKNKFSFDDINARVLDVIPDAQDVTEIKAYKNTELAELESLEELELKVRKESEEKLNETQNDLPRI